MKKRLNDLLSFLPFNGSKLNLGLLLGAILQIAPNLLSFIPPPYAELASAALVLIGALHKLVKA